MANYVFRGVGAQERLLISRKLYHAKSSHVTQGR